jgi:aryl-alcohol dehydrogenase-like predicted oxidoreductase
MRYRTLGDSGLLVSVVGLGCNNFGGRLDATQANAVVSAAIDEGVTLLDTSDSYGKDGGSEKALGEALKGRRDKVVLATKWGHQSADMGYGPAAGAKGGRGYIKLAVEKSLARLKTDYIDLYQLHTPDPVTPIDETLAALDELVAAGKVRYVGHSNFTGWMIADAAHTALSAGRTPFISAQNHWSLLERDVEREVVPAARHFGVGVLPFFPLANGLLTGKVRRGQDVPANSRLAEPRRAGYVTDAKLDKVEALIDWGRQQGVSLLEIAVGALAAQPGCSSVIAGATSPEQVKANAAAGRWEPTTEQLAAIDEIVPPPLGLPAAPPAGGRALLAGLGVAACRRYPRRLRRLARPRRGARPDRPRPAPTEQHRPGREPAAERRPHPWQADPVEAQHQRRHRDERADGEDHGAAHGGVVAKAEDHPVVYVSQGRQGLGERGAQ